MTAELIFDELGFIQSTHLRTLWYECEYQEVFFDLDNKEWGVLYDEYIDEELQEAIDLQIKELGGTWQKV
jgi:hypothetical protein